MAAGGIDTNILSDETFDFLCTVCKNKGRNREAEKYCTDCQDYYCLTCVKVHDDIPLLQGHKILDKGKFQPGASKPLPVVPTERCDRHGHKPVDMYCQKHDDVGCAACMAVKHKPCQDIFYIPEYIQTKARMPISQNIQMKLKTVDKKLKDNISNFQQNKQNILKRKAKSIENIRKFRREINKKLDEMEQNSITEIEDKYKVMIKKIEEDIRALQEAKADLTSAIEKLASAGSNMSQIFVSTKKGQAVADKAEKRIDEKGDVQNEDIIFTANPKIQEILQELKALGMVAKSNRENITENAILLQAKEIKKYTVKLPSDEKDCDIFSSCFLEDGTIILSDYNNNKLKCLDKYNFSVKCHYNLTWNPWQVCSIDNLEVAVSSRSRQEILFITVGNKMVRKSLMKLDFDCFGLAYADSNLYISDFYTTVYMYSMSGRKLKQFNLDKSGLTSDFFCSLAVSEDGSKVYAGKGRNGLVVLNANGQVVKHFNGQKLGNASSCHVSSNGSVLVCGYAHNNILQFTYNGELIGEVLKSKEIGTGYQTVCCNKQMSKIIVGRRTKDEIEVYDLMY